MNKSETSLGSRIFPWTKVRWKPHSFVGRVDFFKSLYTGAEDERTINSILNKGLEVRGKIASKWIVARLALAYSLRITTPPDEELDHIPDRGEGGKIHLRELTGQGKFSEEGEMPQDYDDAICALLSVYHRQNLFNTPGEYGRLLQRHVRRGLREFRNGWREGHDFYEFLFQELFAGQTGANQEKTSLLSLLEKGLAEIAIKGEIRKELPGPRLTRFFLHLPDVNDLDKLRKSIAKLNFFLGLQQQSIFLSPTSESKVMGLDIPRARETWRHAGGHDLAAWTKEPQNDKILPVWPGVDVLGEPYCFDLALAPHLFVGGTTGSGKSVCLHALIISLLRYQKTKMLQLCLIDPKRVEFEPYRKLTRLFGSEVITEAGDAEDILNELIETMERRSERLAALGVRNIQEAHDKGEQGMPYIVVFVEELSHLFSQTKTAEEHLVRLAEKARFAGIHLVLATQRPDAATFSGLLRSNVPARIALTVQKATESKIIMDDTGAEGLTGLGDMWVKTAQGDLTRIHGVKIVRDDISAAINAFQRSRT